MRRLRYSVPYIAGKNLPKDSDPAPCGAGPRQPDSLPPRNDFNPLAPCGAGLDFRRFPAVRGISIHPPLAGRDCSAARPVKSSKNFNPPAPCGAGHLLIKAVSHGKIFQSTRPLRGGTAILHKKTVQNIAYCTKSAFTLAVLSGFLALMRPFFLPNVHKFRCEPSEESLLAPRSHAYTIRTPSG